MTRSIANTTFPLPTARCAQPRLAALAGESDSRLFIFHLSLLFLILLEPSHHPKSSSLCWTTFPDLYHHAVQTPFSGSAGCHCLGADDESEPDTCGQPRPVEPDKLPFALPAGHDPVDVCPEHHHSGSLQRGVQCLHEQLCWHGHQGQRHHGNSGSVDLPRPEWHIPGSVDQEHASLCPDHAHEPHVRECNRRSSRRGRQHGGKSHLLFWSLDELVRRQGGTCSRIKLRWCADEI